MVLKKVGEYITKINVNGTERVNTTQSDDKTYDIVEELSSAIKVNGSNKGTFTQTGNVTYNVNANASVTITESGSDSFSNSKVIANLGDLSSLPANFSHNISISAEPNNQFASFNVKRNGNKVANKNDFWGGTIYSSSGSGLMDGKWEVYGNYGQSHSYSWDISVTANLSDSVISSSISQS